MFANQIPAKVFEYILTGKPILAIITKGEVRKLLMSLMADQKNLWISLPDVTQITQCLEEIIDAKSRGDLLCEKRNQDVISQISRKNLTSKLAIRTE